MRIRTAVAVAVVPAIVLALAACASSGGGAGSSDSSANGKTRSYTVVYIGDQTGLGQSTYTEARRGAEFALQHLQQTGALGDIQINVQYEDTTSTASVAAQKMNQAVRSDAIAVLGPGLSNEAVALAPLAQRSKVPYLTVQAGSKGVVDAGDHIFRVTPPLGSYQEVAVDYLKQANVKSAYLLYNASLPTAADVSKETFPGLFKDAGITLTGSASYQGTNTDFGSYTAQAIATHPDAIGIMTSVAEPAALVSQIRDSGYQGVVFGELALGVPGALNGAGQKAAGTTWAINFNAERPTSDSAKEFVQAFQAKEGRLPTPGEAEGYDMILLLATALKQVPGDSRADLQQALLKVTQAGLSGAQGDLTFDNRDARVQGVMVEWDGSKIVPVKSAG